MSKIISYKGFKPVIHESVFMGEGSVIVGDVQIGSFSSIWFNAVVRGDVCPIRIGERTNVQDNSTLHVTHDTGPLYVGNDVTIGHNAVLHACTVNDFVLIGMGAMLLDKCIVEPFSYVAAGALVRQGFVVPTGMMVAGVPAKVIRPINDLEREAIRQSPGNYMNYVRNYLKESE